MQHLTSQSSVSTRLQVKAVVAYWKGSDRQVSGVSNCMQARYYTTVQPKRTAACHVWWPFYMQIAVKYNDESTARAYKTCGRKASACDTVCLT